MLPGMLTAVYLRISQDRDATRLGVERQLEDCRKVIADRGWSEVAVFEDNDVSAYKGNRRPEYLRLVGAIDAGEVEAVVTWASDRLWRNVGEQQVFLGLPNLKIVVAGGTPIKTGDEGDEFMATLFAAVGQMESAKSSKRQRRRQIQMAEQGAHHGGPRLFGYTSDRSAIVEPEAAAIRDAVTRLLAGDSAGAVITEWNAAGLTTANSNPWKLASFRELLQRPALAGLRVHNGVIIGKASWIPILDEQQQDRLRVMFAARKHGPRTRAARRNLLAGMLVCGKCGQTMRGHGKPNAAYQYRCATRSQGGCGRLTIVAPPTEDYVRDQALARLDSKEFAKAVKRAQAAAKDGDHALRDLMGSLDADRARLLEIETDYADGGIDKGAFQRMTLRLRTRITSTEAELQASTPLRAPAPTINATELARGWDVMTLDERRTILRSLIHSITIRAGSSGPRWSSDRIAIDWAY